MIVKQNTLKSQSEKNRKEEEKTKEGSLVQVTKVLNDKTLNQVAVNEHTTVSSRLVNIACNVFGVVRVFDYLLRWENK